MAGIMNKIGETLHMGGGKKEGEQHKRPEERYGAGVTHNKPVEQKEGLMDKIKNKLPGGEQHKKPEEQYYDGGAAHKKPEGEKKKKKKKKEKKKHEDGHKSSSSSDSD